MPALEQQTRHFWRGAFASHPTLHHPPILQGKRTPPGGAQGTACNKQRCISLPTASLCPAPGAPNAAHSLPGRVGAPEKRRQGVRWWGCRAHEALSQPMTKASLTSPTFPTQHAGGWRFSMDDSDPHVLALEVHIGKHLATTEIETEVLPRAVQLLISGRLLSLHLPDEVCPDACRAARSRATGILVLTLPREGNGRVAASKQAGISSGRGKSAGNNAAVVGAAQATPAMTAAVVACGDGFPPL